MNAPTRRGFTLIEILVALAVFGVLSLLAYMSLSQTLANSDMLGERMTRLQSIQKTVSYLSSELLQVAPRPVRVELGGVPLPALQSSLASEFALQLTRGGWPNFAGAPRSTMQRVAYRIEDGDLLRYHWYVLDRTINSQPVGTVMLEERLQSHLPVPAKYRRLGRPVAAAEFAGSLADAGGIDERRASSRHRDHPGSRERG